MWTTPEHTLPALDEQVIGISADIYGGEVAWWTRTTDGWYVSEKRGQVGHRDAMTKERSKGPDLWTHAPRNQFLR